MMLAQGLRILAQAFYFIYIARALGVDQYGAFVGAASLVAIVFPFSALGAGDLLVKNVSRNPALFNTYWGNSLLLTLVTGSALTVGVTAASFLILPQSIPKVLVFTIAIADLFFFRLTTSAGQAFQAFLKLDKTALLNIVPNALRAFAAILFTKLSTNPSVTEWSYYYLISSFFAALLSFLLVQFLLGSPKPSLSVIQGEMTEGAYFSVSLSAQTIYNDIDKTMLARLSTLEATGIYAAAYRIIDVAFVPVRSLLAATYANFFKSGSSGIKGTLALSKRMLPKSTFLGLISALGLFFGAPIVPRILGEEYSNSVDAIRWLALIPLIKSIQYFGADTLTGAGFQKLRSVAQLLTAGLNVILNLYLIPIYSWLGAAWSSLISDGFLMISLWLMVFFLYRKSERASQEVASNHIGRN